MMPATASVFWWRLPAWIANALDLRIEEDALDVARHAPRARTSRRTGRYQQMEIAFGEFELAVPLSAPVDAEAAQAWYHNGFLSVCCRRFPTPKPVHITLSVPEG